MTSGGPFDLGDVSDRQVMRIDPKLPRAKLVALIRDERDPAVLGTFLDHHAWQVRWAAIKSLGETGSPAAEVYLLRVLDSPRDQDDLTFANAALSRVGSEAAIPALTGLIHHPVDDVRCSAINALGILGDSSLTPVYLDALSDRSWAAKSYAMGAIHQNADERAIGPVVARLHVILSRERTRHVMPWTEVMYALDFLQRWSTDARSQEAIAWVRAKRLDRLQDDERAWFDATFR